MHGFYCLNGWSLLHVNALSTVDTCQCTPGSTWSVWQILLKKNTLRIWILTGNLFYSKWIPKSYYFTPTMAYAHTRLRQRHEHINWSGKFFRSHSLSPLGPIYIKCQWHVCDVVYGITAIISCLKILNTLSQFLQKWVATPNWSKASALSRHWRWHSSVNGPLMSVLLIHQWDT